ncbi:MAG TPA: PTS fructose transporter subunit IIA [Gammaproteobacteria bacterium]|nr:PTS fructose transporter subunit IIA [Gammaproteobacteria bacterium]HIK69867.1 PTS fructose transporter subunit IIA [Pseudomonadales bacterium]
MKIASILSPSRTHCRIAVSSKKRAIEKAAELIASNDPRLEESALYSQLIAREKVSPTGLGKGIAIPHCRMTGCNAIIGSLITLQSPIEFDAIDGLPVSALFVLIVPEHETKVHLEVLSMLVQNFENPSFHSRILAASDSESLYLAAISDPSKAASNT